MNYKESESKIKEIETWYANVIHRVSADAGGYEQLSKRLNKNSQYISALLRSNKSFKNLRQCVKLIVENKLWPEE